MHWVLVFEDNIVGDTLWVFFKCLSKFLTIYYWFKTIKAWLYANGSIFSNIYLKSRVLLLIFSYLRKAMNVDSAKSCSLIYVNSDWSPSTIVSRICDIYRVCDCLTSKDLSLS